MMDGTSSSHLQKQESNSVGNQKLENKEAGNWGQDLKPIFSFASWVHRRRFYRPWYYIPKISIASFGHFVGNIFMGKMQRSQKKIISSMKALFPDLDPKTYQKLYVASVGHMGQLMTDMLFHFPNINKARLNNFIRFKHLDRLDAAIAQGKGVLLPSLHTGNLFHLIGGLAYQDYPAHYKTGVIGNFQNLKLFENLMNRTQINPLRVIATADYASLRKELHTLLHQNYSIIIYYDYTKQTHLRVPFWQGKYPFLMPTSQGVISLHRETDAVIVPTIVHPDGEIYKSVLEFLDPEPLANLSRRLKDAPQRIFHGEMSLTLNRQMAPYIRNYAHVWEEVVNFGVSRISNRVHFPKECTLDQYLQKIEEKALLIVENSYEPKRKDELLIEQIKILLSQSRNALIHPTTIINKNKFLISLGQIGASLELKRLINTSISQLMKHQETNAIPFLIELSQVIENCQGILPSEEYQLY